MTSSCYVCFLLGILMTSVSCELSISNMPVGQGDITLLKCDNGELTLIDSGNTKNANSKNFLNGSKFQNLLKERQIVVKNIILMHPQTVTPRVVQATNLDSFDLFLSGKLSDYASLSKQFLKNAANIYGITHSGGKRPDSCGFDLDGLFYPCRLYDMKSELTAKDSATVLICEDEYVITLITSHITNPDSPDVEYSVAWKITPHPRHRDLTYDNGVTEAVKETPSMLILGGPITDDFYLHAFEANAYYMHGVDSGNNLATMILWAVGIKSDILSISNMQNKGNAVKISGNVAPLYTIFTSDSEFMGNYFPACEIIEKISEFMRKKNVLDTKEVECINQHGDRQVRSVSDLMYLRTIYMEVLQETTFYDSVFTMSFSNITSGQQRELIKVPRNIHEAVTWKKDSPVDSPDIFI